MKEDRVLRIGFNPTSSIPPRYNNTTHMLYEKKTKYTNVNKNEYENSKMGPLRQNPIQKYVRAAHPSVYNFST